MQILVLDNYEWGHVVPKAEKPKLATALEYAVEKFEPKQQEQQPCEVVVYQTAEDLI